MASAVQIYVNRYAVLPGKRAVIFTNNDSAYQVAADIIAAGIDIALIVDSRDEPSSAVRELVGDTHILTNHVIARTVGWRQVQSVIVQSRLDGSTRSVPCDLLCVSGGWNPTVHLYSQSRSSLKYNEA